jgi:hypothetical protein
MTISGYTPAMDLGFIIIQTFYWLALATWFGGVLFVTMAAPVIFRTVGESDPILPTVLSVNLEGQHGTLLAGSIVANLLAATLRIQLACAAVLGLCFIAHWKIFYHLQLGLLVVRTVLFVMAVALLIYDWRVVSPRIFENRQKYIDNADEPEIANAAKEQFDRYHHESVNVLMLGLGALLGLVLFSAGISTAQSFSFGH